MSGRNRKEEEEQSSLPVAIPSSQLLNTIPASNLPLSNAPPPLRPRVHGLSSCTSGREVVAAQETSQKMFDKSRRMPTGWPISNHSTSELSAPPKPPADVAGATSSTRLLPPPPQASSLKLHKHTFQPTTIFDLCQLIEKKTLISETDQKLFLNDVLVEEISHDLVFETVDMKSNVKIELEHGDFDLWKDLAMGIKSLKDSAYKPQQKELMGWRKDLETFLEKSSLPRRYKSVKSEIDACRDFLSSFDANQITMTEVLKQKFGQLIEPARNTGDSIHLCLTFVDQHNIRWYCKPHMGGPVNGSATGRNPDEKEIFGYQLLKQLNIGPNEVIFLPSQTGTRKTVFICTNEVLGWRDANSLMDNETDDTKLAEICVKIHFLSSVLQFQDLHSFNFGIDENRNLRVVDFEIASSRLKGYRNDSCFADFTTGKQSMWLGKPS
uniref:Uncharacterized protein n=1 Tax=Ditylenchus dipsaci TaxID=166011 RepID=A0A915ETF2_9BILA